MSSSVAGLSAQGPLCIGSVVTRGASVYMILAVPTPGTDIVAMLRIETSRPARHRADVVATAQEALGSGLPVGPLVIRCVLMSQRCTGHWSYIGQLSKPLVARVCAAVITEAAQRQRPRAAA